MILFGDAAAAVIAELNTRLPAFSVAAEAFGAVPAERPATMIVVTRTGGVIGAGVDRAQLTFEAWAPTKEAAHDLAQAAVAIIGGMRARVVGGITITKIVPMSGLAENPDPLTGTPRFEFSIQVSGRGKTLEGTPI
jgi:hypothetical protein